MSEDEKRAEREKIKLRILKMLEKRDKQKITQEIYHKSTKVEPKKIHGKLYVSKENKNFIIKTIIPAVMGVVAIVLTSKGVLHLNYLDEYRTKLDIVAREELSPEEYQQYKEDHSSFFANISEYSDNLKEAEEYLKENGNYNFWGTDKDNSDKYELNQNEVEAGFHLTDLQKDAILEAVENEIDEYKGRGK